MSQFAQFIYSALVLGAIFSTMAIGLALVWGGLRMLNMAHGALIMVGAYLAYFAVTHFHVGPVPGLLIAVVGTSAVGALFYPLLVRPLIGRQGWELNVIIATVAVSLLLSQSVQLLFGPKSKGLPTILEGGFLGPAGVYISYQTLAIAGVALIALAALSVFLSRTREGIALRAVAQNLEGARLIGLPIGRIYATTLGLSAGLAALSGVLLAGGFLFLDPGMGLDPMLKALVVVILGGLGSVRGTIAAAFAIGLVNSGVETYVGPQWTLPVLFLLVILVLFIRPSGFFGRAERLA